MVVGDEQLLAVTQVPLTETAAECAVKGTARRKATGSAADFREYLGLEFKQTSQYLGVFLKFFNANRKRGDKLRPRCTKEDCKCKKRDSEALEMRSLEVATEGEGLGDVVAEGVGHVGAVAVGFVEFVGGGAGGVGGEADFFEIADEFFAAG